MTLEDINTMLEELNIPVAYNHFNESIAPPYAVYYVVASDNTVADDQVYTENVTINIELYTAVKDLVLEKQLKDILNQNDLPYEQISETYIENDNVYEILFEITIMGLEYDSRPMSI